MEMLGRVHGQTLLDEGGGAHTIPRGVVLSRRDHLAPCHLDGTCAEMARLCKSTRMDEHMGSGEDGKSMIRTIRRQLANGCRRAMPCSLCRPPCRPFGHERNGRCDSAAPI